jgi:hypothetical protein
MYWFDATATSRKPSVFTLSRARYGSSWTSWPALAKGRNVSALSMTTSGTVPPAIAAVNFSCQDPWVTGPVLTRMPGMADSKAAITFA